MSIETFGGQVRRAHEMPFGTSIMSDGAVAFQLWAPSAESAALCLYDAGGAKQLLSLDRDSHGFFHTVSDLAAAGSLYHFLINDEFLLPDPASRFQPDDVNGPSEVIDPRQFVWNDESFTGRPWEETVLYELHVGAFSPDGDFAGVRSKLPELAELGITAIELMPVSDFPGKRNWGYDGVLPFAPDSSYGRPEDLKQLVEEAHSLDLMVFLDVVYNHFGPQGNYLHLYANEFFTEKYATPWGAAIDFSRAQVRKFFVENALFWLNEYHFDGLRLDAVHAIFDHRDKHILHELAEAVKRGPGAKRKIHLVLENDCNQAEFLARDERHNPRWFTAQWNDDFHHCLHVLATGEKSGYYADYESSGSQFPTMEHLGRVLAAGYTYQGERSSYHSDEPRGQPSAHLPPAAFVNFLQNHDQIGNRALGERLSALASQESLRALTAILLLAPSPPLIFMGDEWCAESPFYFFCDFDRELSRLVNEGRRKEFARFPAFESPSAREKIPAPSDRATFESSKLDWGKRADKIHRQWLEYYHELLELRRKEITPRLAGMKGRAGQYCLWGSQTISVNWILADDSDINLVANLSDKAACDLSASQLSLLSNLTGAGRIIFQSCKGPAGDLEDWSLPAWQVVWTLNESGN